MTEPNPLDLFNAELNKTGVISPEWRSLLSTFGQNIAAWAYNRGLNEGRETVAQPAEEAYQRGKIEAQEAAAKIVEGGSFRDDSPAARFAREAAAAIRRG